MKTDCRVSLVACGFALLLWSGCAAPKFQQVTQIPAGHGLVYVYAIHEAVAEGTSLSHNGQKLCGLGPDQYVVHFPEPGTNSYGFRMGYFSRGGLIGMLLTQHDPEATQLRVEAGRTYYLRMIGAGMGASLWRVEESTGLAELQQCHPIEIEKNKRLAAP